MTQETEQVNLEDAFQGLFQTSATGTGEEELLRIASKFALQVTSPQIQCLLYLKDLAIGIEKKDAILSRRLKSFITDWLEYKQHNNSDIFVMKSLEQISLRKFFNENSFKVDIQK